jgi:hypothetical protein
LRKGRRIRILGFILTIGLIQLKCEEAYNEKALIFEIGGPEIVALDDSSSFDTMSIYSVLIKNNLDETVYLPVDERQNRYYPYAIEWLKGESRTGGIIDRVSLGELKLAPQESKRLQFHEYTQVAADTLNLFFRCYFDSLYSPRELSIEVSSLLENNKIVKNIRQRSLE